MAGIHGAHGQGRDARRARPARRGRSGHVACSNGALGLRRTRRAGPAAQRGTHGALPARAASPVAAPRGESLRSARRRSMLLRRGPAAQPVQLGSEDTLARAVPPGSPPSARHNQVMSPPRGAPLGPGALRLEADDDARGGALRRDEAARDPTHPRGLDGRARSPTLAAATRARTWPTVAAPRPAVAGSESNAFVLDPDKISSFALPRQGARR